MKKKILTGLLAMGLMAGGMRGMAVAEEPPRRMKRMDEQNSGEPQRGPWGKAGSTLAFAKRMEAGSYRFAQEQKAEIALTEDQRSFTLWWQPAGFEAARDTVLVSLHGHQGWATRDFQVWFPKIQGRRYAVLTVQWWYGRSAEWDGYAKPNDIYRWILEALRLRGIPPGHVIFQGYSMGSANSYAVTYADRLAPRPYFAVTIANAGSFAEDFPPNRRFLDSADKKPFTGTRWILYCSELDEEQADCCGRMEKTQATITALGGTVERFFRDPGHSHGGFMLSDYVTQALDLADGILRKSS